MAKRIALVTGSSKGIGRDIAIRLAEVCSGVVVHYMNNRQAAEKVVNRIKEKGKLSESFRADLTKEKEAVSLIRNVEERFGGVDILVNNFGPILVKPWEQVTSFEWELVLRANLLSALYCLKAVLPRMRKREWGRIVNLGYSRVEQLAAFSTITPYAIAKTGLLILTRSVAASEASAGITVNMVSPGLMKGGILPESRDIPRGRLGKFKDVSHAVLFLVSEEADFITGTNLIVAGGWKI
ncbi:MAG: SDR family oxidoreductase [Candidatus Aminicenantes bacterium]|nr:MAG: SDR family oxidoreductase [Candidatus Aminicenantes bacterium]